MQRAPVGLSLLMASILAACASPPAPGTPPATTESSAAPPAPVVWTARPGVELSTESGVTTLPRAMMRLDAISADPQGLRVRCSACAEPLEGVVARNAVIYEAVRPIEAARGSVAEFALAVRAAAERRDVEALREVMSPDFSFTFGGAEGRLEALGAWEREGYRSLDRLSALLDRGVVDRWEGQPASADELWVAPPEYLSRPDYLDLRAGFRRVGGEWRWVFFVGGD